MENTRFLPNDSNGGARDGGRRDLSKVHRELRQLEERIEALCCGAALPSPDRFETPKPESAGFAHGGAASATLLDHWKVITRRKGTILLLSFLGMLGGLLCSIPQTPVYQARTSLEIQGLNSNFLNMGSVSPFASASGSFADDLQTQVKILQSESLIERTANKLQLDQKPEFAGPGGWFAAWRKALGLMPADPAALRSQALEMAARRIKVQSSEQNRVVEILCDSSDPQFAADFANTLASEYIEQNVEARWNSTQNTGEWLTRQLEDLKIKLEKSEDQLQAYAGASGLIFTSEKENVMEGKLKQLQEDLSKAKSERLAKQTYYEMVANSPPEALVEALNDSSLREYQVKLTDLRRQVADLSSSLTPVAPRMVRLRSQMAEVESSLKKETANIVARIRGEYEAARRKEELVATDYDNQAKLVSEQAAKVVHYDILKREVDTNRQLYEALLQKVKEAGIAAAMRASNVRVIDRAKAPARPYRPNLLLNAAGGLLCGVFASIICVLAKERSDRSLRSPGDASLILRVPELGAIPAANGVTWRLYPGRREALLTLGAQHNGGLNGKNGTAGEKSDAPQPVELATWQRKPSELAESFRTVLASILFSGHNGDRPRVLVITSPGAGEGKTTVASNLAIALSEIGRRVLLIDADLRKPRLHHIFDLPNTWGLSDLLREKNSIESCPREALARETKIPGLYLLPSGPGTASISQLFYSPRVSELLQRASKEFDTVLIDTPPMLQISDARVLARLAEAVILVLRAGRTSRDTALAARQRFTEDGACVLGTILNRWDPNFSGYGYYSNYYSYRHE